MKKFIATILFLLAFAVSAKAQDFLFEKNSLEATYIYCGSVALTGDSITADVQGYLNSNAKDFDAGSIGLFVAAAGPTEVAVTLSSDIHKARFSFADSLTTKYSNYIDISMFTTVKAWVKLVHGTGSAYTAYIYISNAKGETLVQTLSRQMDK